MSSNAPFNKLDFLELKENLKDFLKSQDKFVDFDFDGSNMSVLLDILSYNTYHNNIYRNMVFSETFLDSAQLRENVMSHAKELNYLPSSTQSSKCILDVTINVSDILNGPMTILIPRGTKFNASCGTKNFTFITDQDRVVKKTSNEYRIRDLSVYEGKTLREFYTVDDMNAVEYIINNENVDIRDIKVTVREDENVNSKKSTYIYKKDIFGVESTQNVFYIEPHFNNLYKISFGRNKFGKEPSNGNVIEIEYRLSTGEESNGARNWTSVNNISGYPVIVNNPTARASNGSERESIEDIKFFGPKSIQIQERAVTTNDYEILLKQRFPNIQTISVYGGDEASPPQYGKVIISVDVFGTDGAGDSEIQEYKNYLRDKTPLTIEPIFVPAEFLYVDLDVKVFYDPNITRDNEDTLESNVRNAILNFSDSNLNKFNSTLRQSRLSAMIDSVDNSFLSTDITSRPIIEYLPTLNVSENPLFDFNDSLVKPYVFNEDVGFDSYDPAIRSTNFHMKGTEVSLQDDGKGNIIAVTTSSSNKRIFDSKVGTVDYTTGTVRLIDINIQEYDGLAIKIIAKTENKDINSSRNKILVIRDQDLTIEMVSVR